MTWTATEGSHIFRTWVQSIMFKQSTPTTGTGEIVTNDAVKAALYGNTGTPDRNSTQATTGYNAAASQWVVANEVSTGSEWVAGGRALTGKSLDVGTANIAAFKASNLTGVATVTLANVYGCLVYDDTIAAGGTIADQGICFNYFGGAQSVTSGTFSVNWNAAGIMNITI
jgi:hypothetical protein